MSLHHSNRLSRQKLQKTIANVVKNVESVMNNINTVLQEVRELVGQIDTMARKIEAKYDNHPNGVVQLDANGNVCGIDVSDVTITSLPPKTILALPQLDFTLSDLSAECNIYEESITSFINYNDKYPLWIQCDTWKSKTSISDMSEVSAESNTACHMSDDHTWKSVSNTAINKTCVGRHKRSNRSRARSTKSTAQVTSDFPVKRFSQCCTVEKTEHGCSDIYCGVYEDIMEELLEDNNDVIDDVSDLSDDDLWSSSVESDDITSL